MQRLRDGSIEVAIWAQRGEHGTFHNTTVRRSYKDEAANEWKESDSFGRYDLLSLAKLLDKAHSWIVKTEAAQRAAERQSGGDDE